MQAVRLSRERKAGRLSSGVKEIPVFQKPSPATAGAAGREPHTLQQYYQVNRQGKGNDRRTRGIPVKKHVLKQRQQLLLGDLPASALRTITDSKISAEPAATSLHTHTHKRCCSLPARTATRVFCQHPPSFPYPPSPQYLPACSQSSPDPPTPR